MVQAGPVRARAYTVRIQLSKEQQAAWLPQLKADVTTYPLRFQELVIGGPELAPSTNMRHVHIYAAFEAQRTIQQATKLLRLDEFRPWVEPANKKNRDRIITHHGKERTKENASIRFLLRFPEEKGYVNVEADGPASKRQKTSGPDLREAIESGDLERVKDLNYMLYIKTKGAIETECAKHRAKTDDAVYEHLWIVGKTGEGKSAYVKYRYPDAYDKDLSNPNFEEYNGETVVIMDDFDNKRLRLMTVGKLKNLCNPAGTRCKVNYGCVLVKAKIIVTSQYSILECFKHKGKQQFIPHNADPINDDASDDPDYQAIKRRFKEISIKKLLMQENLQLKCRGALKHLTAEQQAAYDVFEPFDPERKDDDPYSEYNQSTYTTRSVGTQTKDSDDSTTDEAEGSLTAIHPHYRIMETIKRMENGTHVVKHKVNPPLPMKKRKQPLL